MAETYLVSVSVPREQAETFEALLSGLPGAIVGRRAPLIDTGLDLRDSDELEVLAYFDLRPDEADVQALLELGDQITGLHNTAFAFETLPDVDWVAESQSALTAIHAGRFFLRGSHDPSPVPAGAAGAPGCQQPVDGSRAQAAHRPKADADDVLAQQLMRFPRQDVGHGQRQPSALQREVEPQVRC